MEKQEVKSVGKWISIIHRQTQIYLNKELKKYDLNSSEYIYLINLFGRKEGINQKQLSDMILIDDALTTRAMKSLEMKGYIKREKNTKDKRSFNITLTNKGIEKVPLIHKVLNNWTAIISENIDEKEIEYIIGKLMTISDNALQETKGGKQHEIFH